MKITARQREIYELMLTSLSYEEIATKLNISLRGVNHHAGELFKVLELNNRVNLMANRIHELEGNVELLQKQIEIMLYSQPKRDLEQQAKGAADIITSVLGKSENLTSAALSLKYEFLDKVKQLREQGKGS